MSKYTVVARSQQRTFPHTIKWWRGIIVPYRVVCAGAGARMIVAPLDLIRIRLQLEPNKSIFAHVQHIATESGLRGFFRGNVPATYLWVGYTAVQI